MNTTDARRDWADAYWLPWAAVGLRLLVAAGICVANYWLLGRLPSFWSGDTPDYVTPVENLLAHGTFARDLHDLPSYAGRMPGYALPYLLWRLLLPAAAAQVALVATQVLVGALSVRWLGQAARQLTSTRVAALVMLAYALSTFSISYDLLLLSESLAISGLIGLVCWLLRWRQAEKVSAGAAVGMGCLLAWLVFLRPFLLLLALALPLLTWLLLVWPREGWRLAARRWWRPMLLLYLPLALAEGAWVARNWPLYHRVVPLQTDVWAGHYFPDSYQELVRFSGALGEEPVPWHEGTLMAWFSLPDGAEGYRWQPRDFAPAYTADSLLALRRLYRLANTRAVGPACRLTAVQQIADAQATAMLRRYRRAYVAEHPLQYRLQNPLQLGYYLTLAHGSITLFARSFQQLPLVLKLAKLAATGYYLLLVSLGLLSLLWWPRARWRPLLLLRAAPMYAVLLFCLIFRQPEPRYFATAYPFVVLSGVWFGAAGLARCRPRKRAAFA